ncbi:hypothetical protein AGMMS50212_17070 [Spirochaetia bacterium]|nr:hypothetical protein AGMMS50212_17070 [Spirochaetia bacterium]
MNKYSTLGQEEDRSEIIAFFMTDSKHALLIKKAKKDAIFNKKVLCLLKLFSEKLFFPDLMEKYINELNR